ncbi:MAG: hypothetical protein WCT04_21440 [Planctomycetota bacterium]
MFSDSTIFFTIHWLPILACFVPFWLGCYAYAIVFMWRALAPIARTNFHFYITDIWATMLCLIPTLVLFAETTKLSHAERDRDLVGLGILTLSQILGVALGRIFSIPRTGESLPRRTDQALCVVTGAYVFGVAGLFAIIIAFAILALIVLTVVSYPVLGIWFALFGFLVFRTWRKAMLKPK